jgi:hypothetical protein
MNLLQVAFAMSEAGLGLALLVYPPGVVRLLFGAEIGGAGIIMSRVAGISLLALGVGCWPSRNAHGSASCALRAMSSYSLLATLYLAYLGITGEWVGVLLWPAFLAHAGMTVLLARAWFGACAWFGNRVARDGQP